MAKLSEMTTERAASVIAAITPPMGRLLKNAQVQAFITNHGGMDVTPAFAITALMELAPVLLKANADDTFAIIAALSEKTVATVKKQTLVATIKDLKGCMDGELFELFGLSSSTEPEASSALSQQEESPSAATE